MLLQMIDWTHAGPSMLAAFLASLVEFVEALTVVLAVGITRGWRPALIGAGSAGLVLLAIVLLLGPSLSRIPLGSLQLIVGILLLLFGMRWLSKAVLRAAGVIALHDEAAAFDAETTALRGGRSGTVAGLDSIALATSFKTVMLEGIEVVFIVIAIGAAGNLLIPAGIGAAAALVVVILLGVILHRPLAKVPENTLKFAVGVLLSAFGAFWSGEGLGFHWPGDDWSLFGLTAGFLAAALVAVPLARRRRMRRALAA
jgi:uncharacterized membrane protein